MRRLWLLAWRRVAARPLRSLLTTAGIALGVAALFAALVTNASIEAAVDRTVQAQLGRADLRVAAFTEAGLSAATVQAIAETPGVAVAAPELERETYPELALSPTAGLPRPVTVLGVDPAVDGRLHDLAPAAGTGLAAGTGPAAGSGRSALVSETLAGDEHLAVGGQVTLLGSAAAGPTAFTTVGLLPGDGPLPGAGGRLVVVPLAAAQALFDTSGVSRVDVGLVPGADAAAVSLALESRLTREPYVLSGPADLAASLRASTAGFQVGLALVAAVALFVGAFLIFNTLSMTVAERVREVGLLRAAGTTRRQVLGLVLLEALTLGLGGAILGLAAGLALAGPATGLLGSLVALDVSALAVTPAGMALAIGLGLLVTAAAAIEPAWRASRISPVEALRPVAVQPAAGRARLRWLVVVFAAVAVAGLSLWPGDLSTAATGGGAAFDGTPPGGEIVGGLLRPLVVYGLLLITLLVSPLLLGPLGRLAGLPFAAFLRTEERLARSGLIRDRSRTALTLGALTVGLTLIVAVATVGQDARRAASAWLADVVPGSEILTSIRPIALDDPSLAGLAGMPGVAGLSPMTTFGVPLEGRAIGAAAVVGADLAADGRLTFVAGDRAGALAALDRGGSAILPRSLADRLGVGLGSTLAFATGTSPTELRILGIVARSVPAADGEAMLVGWSDATAHFGVTGARLFAVRYAAGREAAARPALDAAARELALEPAGLDAIGGAVNDTLGRIFGLLDALAVVAVAVAGLGIVNTLSMSVAERVREIGVLRANGMTRGQVWRMVMVEAGILGLVGAVLGIVLGVVVAAVLVQLAGAAPGFGVVLPVPTLGLVAVFAVAVSMLAAAYPARLASGVSIVRALQYE